MFEELVGGSEWDCPVPENSNNPIERRGWCHKTAYIVWYTLKMDVPGA